MLRLNPYLSFNGQCEAAFRYYEKCLGGKVVFMMTYGDSPMAEQTPLNERNKIMHTTLALGDQVLAGADSLTEHYQKPEGMSVALNLDDAAEAERIFKALLENGAVQIPLQETFWAKRFGALVDQFGTPWVINCEKPS